MIKINTKLSNEAQTTFDTPLLSAVIRHKWVKDDRGKYCSKCGSRVNDSLGAKYIEKDKWGVAEKVNWYPRCFPNSR